MSCGRVFDTGCGRVFDFFDDLEVPLFDLPWRVRWTCIRFQALHLFLRPLSVVGWDCSQDWLRFWNSDIKPYQEVYVISIWHWKFSCNRYCWGFLLCRELWLPHFCLIHNAHSSFKLANCGEVFWTRNREIYYFTELGSNFLFRFNDFLEVSSFLFVEGLALLLLKASAMRILWRI